MEDVEIRTATGDDLQEIQRLNQNLCKKEHEEFDATIIKDFPFTQEGEQYFERRVKGDDGCVLVATLDDKIVGYLAGGICEEEFYRTISKLAEVENMLVLKKYRGLGIGTKLLEEFMDWCKSKGIEKVRAVASSQNTKAIDFYRERGFEDYSLILEKEL